MVHSTAYLAAREPTARRESVLGPPEAFGGLPGFDIMGTYGGGFAYSCVLLARP